MHSWKGPSSYLVTRSDLISASCIEGIRCCTNGGMAEGGSRATRAPTCCVVHCTGTTRSPPPEKKDYTMNFLWSPLWGGVMISYDFYVFVFTSDFHDSCGFLGGTMISYYFYDVFTSILLWFLWALWFVISFVFVELLYYFLGFPL